MNKPLRLFLSVLLLLAAPLCPATGQPAQPSAPGGPDSAASALPRPTAADFKAIEDCRLLIGKYYQQGALAEARPLYERYITLLQKVGADDTKMASALQNYADLLRKLSQNADADSAESRAQKLLMKAETRTPYALKDFKLGMSLDDFTRMAPPPATGSEAVKPVCSCDEGQTLEKLSDEDAKAQIIQCGYWRAAGEKSTWLPAPMTVAGIPCTPDFRFVMDGGAYHLFEIYMSFFSSNFKQMREALTSKYGEPSESTEKVRTASGNVFADIALVWDNGISKIKLRKMDGTSPDRSSLRYIHRALYLQYVRRVNDLREKDAQKHASDL